MSLFLNGGKISGFVAFLSTKIVIHYQIYLNPLRATTSELVCEQNVHPTCQPLIKKMFYDLSQSEYTNT